MSEYKGIKGFQVQTRTEDPTPYAQALADNPYAGVWSSGGNMNTTRFGFASGTGTQTAGMISAGEPNPVTAVEQYNGTSWTEVAEMNTSRDRTAGSGTQSATLIISGRLDTPDADSALVESWNGSAWTEVGDVNTARYALAASVGGTYTSTIIFGGAPGQKTNTESWNGSAWTEVNDLPTGKYALGGAGTLTAALSVAGVTTTNVNTVESWDGTNWTSSTAKNTTTGYPGSFGSQTAALATGGWPDGSTELTNTESWNGSSWTEVNDMATARAVHASSGYGSSSTGLVMGGYNSNSGRTTTEEWSFSGLPPSTPAADYSNAITGDFYYNSTTGQFKTVNTGGAPIGTWSSGGNMNTNSENSSMTGTQTATISMGGYGPSAYSNSPKTELWDGSSWTTSPQTLNTGRAEHTSSGTYTAAITASGQTPSYTVNAETWDGSSWTEVGNLSLGRAGAGQFGSQTSAIVASGASPPSGFPTNVEQWNGTAWTEIAEVNQGRYGIIGTAGDVTSGLIMGGLDPGSSKSAKTEGWNGTSWTEVNDMSTARDFGAGQSPTINSAIYFGGATPPKVAATEEFTTTDFQIKTVTTS